MGEALMKMYEMLNETARLEAYNYLAYLVYRQQNGNSPVLSKAAHNTNDFETVLDSFVGCTHAWDNTDVMDYQRQLREEYHVD